MELRTPVKILTGVCMGDSRTSGCVPQVNNTTGTMHGHHFHSTVTDLQTPVYSSAPKRVRTPAGAVVRLVSQIVLFYNYIKVRMLRGTWLSIIALSKKQ